MENMLGPKTIERGKQQYSMLLFPDDISGNSRLNPWLLRILSTNIDARFFEDFYYYPHDFSDHAEKVELKNLCDITGGKKEFFGKDAVILDMASGVGRAANQFSNRRNIIVGMDRRHQKEQPENTERGCYVAGNWKNLPFADNSFSGVMSCEGFPRWEEPENYPQVIADTTRVCKRNAIWRATFRPSLTLNESEDFTGSQ